MSHPLLDPFPKHKYLLILSFRVSEPVTEIEFATPILRLSSQEFRPPLFVSGACSSQSGFAMQNGDRKASTSLNLATQSSHRKVAVTTAATSGLATISLQQSQGFLSPPATKQRKHNRALFGVTLPLRIAGSSQRQAAGRKPRDFAATATTGHHKFRSLAVKRISRNEKH